MQKGLSKILVALICITMVGFPADILSSSKKRISVLVVPIKDGDGDSYSRAISDLIADGFIVSTDFDVVHHEEAIDVIEYHRRRSSDDDVLELARQAISTGKDHFFNFRNEEALLEIDRGIGLLTSCEFTPDMGPVLQDAYLSKALAFKSKNRMAEAKGEIDRAMKLNPSLDITSGEYPPSIVELFDEIKNERSPSVGELYIQTSPKMADVLINGMSQGKTPLRLSDVPVGKYIMSIRANRYDDVDEEIHVEDSKTLRFARKLKFRSEVALGEVQREKDAREQVDLGVHLGNTMKVDKVLLVDADMSGKGAKVASKVVDRKYGVGQVPVILDVEESGREDIPSLARTIELLVANVSRDVSQNPNYEMDPLGMGDPVLMGSRKRQWLRSPVFWGAVGLASAGALAGGIAAAMSGSSSSTGSVRVQFK